MALPAALTGGTAVSVGCIGNRAYTDLGEDGLYVVIPGQDLRRIGAELDNIRAANAELADYHAQRRQQLASAKAVAGSSPLCRTAGSALRECRRS
jgi:hypothetical protein